MHALLLLALAAGPAQAFDHTGMVWSRDDIPLDYYLADTPDDSISWDYIVETIPKSFDNWTQAAPCAELFTNYDGIREGYLGGYDPDYRNTISFEDPDNELETSVLGATLCYPTSELAFSRDGRNYVYQYDCDIVFNDQVLWATTEDIDNGICSDEYSLEAVSTHEIGHLWGMGHSCEQDDVEAGRCEDPNLLDATMFWSTGPCDNFQASPESDDITGMYALYGPYCNFQATDDSERHGGAPLEVCFEAECNAGISDLSWSFGDGETSTEQNPCHTYQDKGQFTVSLTTTGGGDECGSWANTERERAYVLVCGEPAPAEGFTGLFTYDSTDDPLIYQMVNQADTSVYGCVDGLVWEVYQGDSVSGEPIQSISAWAPKIAFPEDGTYTVVLNVNGPGGTAADSLTIDTTAVAGGCSTSPARGGAALLGLLLGLGAVLGRRRQG